MNDTVIKADSVEDVRCSGCNKKLMIIPRREPTTNKEVLFEMIVDCCFCGDKSFQVDLYGPIKYVLADQVLVKDFDVDGKKAHFKTKRSYS